MTIQEFSDQMDVLLNSFNYAAASGEPSNKYTSIVLDEYEKSVFLTEAQNSVVIALYNGLNNRGSSFEETEESRRYLSDLIKESSITPIQNTTGYVGVGTSSRYFTLPKDLWFITYEALKVSDPKCSANSVITVYPVTQDEYHKIKRNPFRGPNNSRALRLDLADGVVEVVSKYNPASYYVRYLSKPTPIILTDLPDGLTIGGESTHMECRLHEALHQKILETAVALAAQNVKVIGASSSSSTE